MAEPLKLVRTPDQAIEAATRDLRTNWKSISDLERKHGLPRNILDKLQKKFDPEKKNRGIVPTPRAPKAPESSPPPLLSAVESRIAQRIYTIGMQGVSLTLGIVGIALNWQFAKSLGQTPLSAQLLGVLGVAIDTAAVFLMPMAAILWDQRRYGQFVLSVVVWLLCAGLSLMAGMSFMAANIGDSLQGREIVTQHRKALNSELSVAQGERGKITEDRDPQVLEEMVQIARGEVPLLNLKKSNDCTDVTTSGTVCVKLNQARSAKRIAERRIELDGRLRSLNEQIASLPPIAVKDPGADYVSKMTAGIIDPDSIEGFRVIGFAAMPSLAGLLLMFARGRN